MFGSTLMRPFQFISLPRGLTKRGKIATTGCPRGASDPGLRFNAYG